MDRGGIMTSKIQSFNKKEGPDSLAKSLCFNIIMVFVVACVIVYVLNIISVNMFIKKIRYESIDYDAFRQMKISEEYLEEFFEFNGSNSFDSKKNDDKFDKDIDYDRYDILTLYMFINDFDMLEFDKISDANMDLMLRSLVYDENFREVKGYYKSVFQDIEVFPVLADSNGENNVSYEDTWNALRSYGGERGHEGTDLMAKENARGKYPLVSVTDGIVEQKGWLDQGGYRLGIRSKSGAYFYYAHLDSYANDLNIGDYVEAGDFIGYMGDTGYGPEGTKGEFDVHLHFGIYIDSKLGEISVNPCYIIKYLEKYLEYPTLNLLGKQSKFCLINV